MISLRILTNRSVLVTLAVVLLAACDRSAELASAALEKQLQETTRALEQSQAALAASNRRVGAVQEALEGKVRTLERALTVARGQFARSESALRTVTRQRDESISRLHRLQQELAPMRADLAGADQEIRRLRARQGPDQRRLAQLYERGSAAARELDELKRYNAYLLRERGNLQAWLEDANTVREQQRDARRRAQEELARVQAQRDAADAANQDLRRGLDEAHSKLAAADHSRDVLADEIAELRAARAASDDLRRALDETRAKLVAVENSRDALVDQVSRLRAAASAPTPSAGGADERRNAPVGSAAAETGIAGQAEQGASSGEQSADAATLHARLEEARRQIVGLRSAKEYLVEKLEACVGKSSSAKAITTVPSARLALVTEWMTRHVATPAPRAYAVNAAWSGPAVGTLAQAAATTPEAEQENRPTEGKRRAREIEAVREKLAALEREHEALKSKLAALEKECAAKNEQVETLTWANEVLVKELDAAYATGGAGKLPEGTRGIYVLKDGESLSRVAQAFYGDASRWRDIVEANKTKIPDPDKVKAGTIIMIPE